MLNSKENKKDLLEIVVRPEDLRDVPGEVTFYVGSWLTKLNLQLWKTILKEKNPNISDEEMLTKLKQIYWGQ